MNRGHHGAPVRASGHLWHQLFAAGCRWRIASLDPTRVVRVTFSSFQTECGYDFVTAYDVSAGSGSVSSTPIARLCGNRTAHLAYDVIVSSGPALVVEFASDVDVQSAGFTAAYQLVSPCAPVGPNGDVCSGRGTCVSVSGGGLRCQCNPTASGTMCERETAGFAAFVPRANLAAAYLADADAMVLAGGQRDNQVLPFDTLQYNFGSWSTVPVTLPGPSDRYSHGMVAINSTVYLYGGIGNQGATTDLWQLTPGSASPQWSRITPRPGPPGSVAVTPPPLYWPTVVAAEDLGKVFVIGGLTLQSGYYSYSRLLFEFDTRTLVWSQRNSSSHPIISTSAAVAASAIYRSASRFIHVFTEYAVQSYHVPTDTWFFDPIDSLTSPTDPATAIDPRLYRSATLFGDNYAVLFGGQIKPVTPASTARACYTDALHIVDLDCWSVVNATSLPGRHRMGHAAVRRGDDELVIAGGFNGVSQSDVVRERIALPPANATARAACRARTWCARSNDCADCVAKPGCGWCGDACVYGCSAVTSASSCPARVPLALGVAKTGRIAGLATVEFGAFINAPDNDLFIRFDSDDVGSGDPPFTVSVRNLPLNATFSTQSTATVFPSTDARRFGGTAGPYPSRLAANRMHRV
ncbi:hypothetical protein H9P43_007998 [Blastocladiella emersonii ATCC 22665]|nr:hypothetical protein H9P43_007998 [Blastocladiella emersonii ATCC 22665]